MLVKATFRNKDYDYFRDIETNTKRVYGDIFECSDELAEERIKKGLVKKASKKEEKEYYANQTTVDDDKKDKEQEVIKPLEEYTDEELWKIVRNENINVNDSVSRDELIETINKIRVERLEQPNN